VRPLSTLGVLFFAVAGSAGCAAAIPPAELVTARAVYDRASHGPAAQVDPTDLHTAKESLDVAERSFDQDGDTQDTRDLGYTAGRRAETAESRARGMMAATQKDQVIAQMHATTATQAQMNAAQLGRANQQIATQGTELRSEVQRRQDAEKRAAAATAALARLSSVRQEARGIVITLSGSVLFTSGKADLLASAQAKLNDVADALTQQDPESKIVVEGHTDSQGTVSSNQDLSQRRAQAVRDYLVSRGISGDRMTSQGFGSTRSIADNASAEGRANNRRVEIVVQPAP
jgi:outer membrane protein OmpA-like peptidoglycan-associated protein